MLPHNLRTPAASPIPVLLLGTIGTDKQMTAQLLPERIGRKAPLFSAPDGIFRFRRET